MKAFNYSQPSVKKKKNINNKIYAYNKNYKDPKEKNIMDFKVRSRIGKKKSSIFILTKFLFRKDTHARFYVKLFVGNTG